jgi:hypothetical protein
MDTLLKADIFFFVSTVCMVLITIGVLILLYYVVRSARRIDILTEKIEANIDLIALEARDEIREIGENIRSSFLYSMLVRKKRKTRLDRG